MIALGTSCLAERHPIEWAILGAMDRLSRHCETFGNPQIKAICREASVSKPTFYRHFDNRSQAVQWHIDQVARISLTRIGVDFTCQQGIELMLSYTLEFEDLYRLLGKTEQDNPCISKNYTSEVFCGAVINTLTRRKRVPLPSWSSRYARSTTCCTARSSGGALTICANGPRSLPGCAFSLRRKTSSLFWTISADAFVTFAMESNDRKLILNPIFA